MVQYVPPSLTFQSTKPKKLVKTSTLIGYTEMWTLKTDHNPNSDPKTERHAIGVFSQFYSTPINVMYGVLW